MLKPNKHTCGGACKCKADYTTNGKRDKHKLYMGVAEAVARFGTCGRASVGAILVKDGRILGTGYNGSPAGQPHCIDVGCLLVTVNDSTHCARTIHAEVNAVVNSRSDVRGATLYCTHEPCHNCMNVLVNAGVSSIIYKHEYPGAKTSHTFSIKRRKL